MRVKEIEMLVNQVAENIVKENMTVKEQYAYTRSIFDENYSAFKNYKYAFTKFCYHVQDTVFFLTNNNFFTN